MTHILEDLYHFLSNSPTSWHAIKEMGNRLASLDFIPLSLKEKWTLEKEKKYFVIHGGSILAFALPSQKPEKMALIATHTDSPALKLKPKPEVLKENMKFLSVEVYGSPLLSNWFNRDLGIAGRVLVLNQNDDIEEHLLYIDDAPLTIPLLAPHLDKEGAKKGFEISKQRHLLALGALSREKNEENYLKGLIQRRLNFKELLSFDLFLVPLEAPRFLGEFGELLASYRLDNLSSVHAALVALGNLKTIPTSTLPIGVFWDHEEIGSHTNVGAYSPFFNDTFKRITDFYQLKDEDAAIMRHKSLCLSVDVAHAFNPSYEKSYDPNHLPLLEKGIVIKHSAQMRYSTNAKSTALLLQLCKRLNLKAQQFVNESDTPAGSTVGPIFSAQFGVETLDIGIPQLSMHAIREIIACQDHVDQCLLLTHFLRGD